MPKLDRSRPFGEVYGPSDHRYEQDGLKFDANGDAVEEPSVLPLPPVEDIQAGTFWPIGTRAVGLGSQRRSRKR